MMATSPGPPKGGGRMTPLAYSRPPTGGRLTAVKTPSSDRFTPLPDYMHPVTKTAPKQWKKLQEDHMMTKLIERRTAKKESNRKTREEAMKLARKIPIDMLAKDWMKENIDTAEARAFLVDKVLPTLILGVEKLLSEVNQRKLDLEQQDPNFNPINFLAQYLMRNNPRYSNFSEASPYIRGLREVGEQLKQQLVDMDDNRLVRVKMEARRRREEREQRQREVLAEKKRRQAAMSAQYYEWSVANSPPDGRIELALIQNALRCFEEVVESSFKEEIDSLELEVEPTDDTGRMLQNKDFVTYLTQFTEKMSRELFDRVIQHMSRCALTYRSQAERAQRKVQLAQLFVTCDHTGVGQLDRHRILSLFEMFYDRTPEESKESLRNPRKWPVVELHEEQFSDDEGDTANENPQESADDQEPKPEDDIELQTPGTESVTADNVTEQTTEEVPQEGSTLSAEIHDRSEAQPAGEGESTGETQEATGEAPEASSGDTQESGPPEEGTTQGTDTEVSAAELTAEGSESKDNKEDDAETQQQEEPQDTEQAEASKSSLGEDGAPASAPSALEPPMTQQSRVSFAEGTSFDREKSLLTSHGTRSHSQASIFDENLLTVSQFIQVTETFLGDIPKMELFQLLVRYIREGYMETEEERMARLMKARMEAREVQRKALLNSLFEMWDNDGSGMIDLDEVETVMRKYKEGMEEEAINKGKEAFLAQSKHNDNRLSKREFRTFFHKVVAHLAGGDGAFDFFIEFLISSVERTYQERVRGEARKKWLQQIISAAETSAANMEPVYKSVFQALYKDAENHGGGKKISAYIAMLETNHIAPQRGPLMIRYTAATPNDADCLLGKALFKDMKGISFAAVESGKPIHVPRVLNHGNIHFWSTDREEGRDGSLIVVPLKDHKKRVFGILGLDTLDDPHSRNIFITHEIQFFQGVAKSFSIAYHHVDVRQKTMRISESAVSWIQRRCPTVSDVTVYMVEPDSKMLDFLLRKMIITDHKANAQTLKNPPRLMRKDNLFRDYLFKCVDNSESVTADAYGERHMAFPLRDDEGRAIVAVDISLGSEQKQLPKLEMREVMKMLRLLQMAYKEISKESKEGQKSILLENDKAESDNSRTDILFDRLMLMELRDNVAKLDATSYAELKSYKEPPPAIHNILKAVLGMFYHDKAKAGEFDDWSKCKNYVNPSLSQKILAYDPTGQCDYNIPLELINSYLDEVPHGTVSKHGSIPAQHLYNWVFVCVSLVEHSRKMAANKQAELLDLEKSLEPKEVEQAAPSQEQEQTSSTEQQSSEDS